MSGSIFDRLQRLGRAEEIFLRAPCDAAALARFQQQATDELGVCGGADWYAPLLRLSDGLQVENVIFDSASDLIVNNLERRRGTPAAARFVVLGSNGNVDSLVYDVQAGDFLRGNFFGDWSRSAEVFERFTSLEDLLQATLRQQGVGEG